MSNWRQKYLFSGTLTVLLILSAYKYYNNYVTTAPEAVSTILREVSDKNRSYAIAEKHMEVIKALYDSGQKYNLPQIEVTSFLYMRTSDVMEKIVFIKDVKYQKWVMVPRRVRETDKNYFERNCNGHYLLQDIKLESKSDDHFKDSYTVTTNINYSEYNGKDKRSTYYAKLIFKLRKISLNDWKVEDIETLPFTVEDNG